MEKIKLNNQVVLMRKYVKQAKVHSINKLVKQVKLLQNRKGNEVQVSKAKRKAERYLEEITILKKIRPDYVSKLALSKAKDWKEVLLQKNSSLEDRCIAVLASYRPVQKEVEDFHNSNQDLVLKISDLITQWEEKNQFPKDSSQKKKSDFKKLQGTRGPMSKMTYQLEGTSNGNNKSLDEKTDSSLLINNSHELRKGNRKIESGQNEKLSTSVKASQKSLPTEKVTEASHISEHVEQKNIMEVEECDKAVNDDENELKNYIDSNAESLTKNSGASGSENESNNESDMEENEDSENEDFRKNELKTNKQTENDTARGNKSESKNESDTEENGDSEDEDILENELDTKSNTVSTGVKKLQNSAVFDRENFSTTCSFAAKMESTGSKSNENKLKEIAVLNLDDFRDLDEIPVNNSVENEETEEEEEGSDDGSLNNASQDDPFFLGRDEAVSTGNNLVDDPKSIQYVSANEIFERKRQSYKQFNSKKNFQTPLSGSHFSGKHSSEQRTQNNSKTWKKDNFSPKNHQHRFQCKSRDSFGMDDSKQRIRPYKPRSFDTGDFKNRKDFNKRTFSDTYRNNRPSNSNDLFHRSGDSSFKKSKLTPQKNDVNSKPLHPSWEAKRKQKELINTSFQGKKIVFED